MSSTFSTSEILADVASLTNSVPFTLQTRITSTRATYWLSQSIRTLSALLRQKGAEDREMMRSLVRQTSSGYRFASLPDECGEVHAVVWQRSANDYVLLKSAQQDDLTSSSDDGEQWADGAEPRWRLEGEAIAFYPPPNKAESIEIWYTTHLGANAQGTFNARLDFDRWVTLDVCIAVSRAKSKADQVGQFQQQKALLEDDLLSRARKRDVNQTRTIRDVRGEAVESFYRKYRGG